MRISWENNNFKNGVSGILRVKNDAEFIEKCIDSCIDALDELIIVYNGCTDNSPQLIECKRKQYPDKIRVFEYPYLVYGVGLSLEEYKKAVNLPDDSPNLLCNYYNFALSKVKYQYALKIDADQVYISNRLKELCDYCREIQVPRYSIKYLIGGIFNLYFRTYRYLCLRFHKEFPIMPEWLVRLFWDSYQIYCRTQFKKGDGCLSLSGVNVFFDKSWFVTLGAKGNSINIPPPFNGENDHLLFKVSKDLYYKKFDTPYYNLLRSAKYSLIEEFVHPYKPYSIGFYWFHLSTMRNNCKTIVEEEKKQQPFCFLSLQNILKMKHKCLKMKSDKDLYSLYQRIIFSLVFSGDKDSICENSHILNNLKY